MLDDYANGILTALNTDGLQPFKYATVQASQMLEQIETSLQQLSKKGGKSRRLCGQKLARLQAIVAERATWAEPLAQVKRLHGWLLEVEHLLDRSPATEGEVLNNVTVGNQLDRWRERMSRLLTGGSLSQLEQEGLREFLQVLSNLRPYLVQCYPRIAQRAEESGEDGLSYGLKKLSSC